MAFLSCLLFSSKVLFHFSFESTKIKVYTLNNYIPVSRFEVFHDGEYLCRGLMGYDAV